MGVDDVEPWIPDRDHGNVDVMCVHESDLVCERVELRPDGTAAQGRGGGGIIFAGKNKEAWDRVRGEVPDVGDGGTGAED